jgi:hypothetical protein
LDISPITIFWHSLLISYIGFLSIMTLKKMVAESKAVQIKRNFSSIVLWSEKGAARHAKILNTEQAWEN